MSELQLGSNVFKVFERISSDKQITSKEAAELQTAIKADGKIDENEDSLLDQINSKLGGSYELTLSTDNKKMSFDPTALAFDPQAKASLQKLENESNFSQYKAQLPALLAAAEKHNDLEALSAAYSNISSTLDTYRRLGVPGVSNSLQKLAESMSRVEKRDLLLSQDQKTKWHQFKHSVAPKESMQMLQKSLLSNKMKDPLDRQVALDFIRDTLPPAKTVAFLKQYAAAHPSEKDDVKFMLSQISKGPDKAGAAAARQAIRDLDIAKPAPDLSEQNAQVKALFSQSPLPVEAIAKALADPKLSKETTGQLLKHLDQRDESARNKILLDLDAAIPPGGSTARQAMDGVLLAYPQPGEKPAEIVRAALWRASKSADPQYQASTLEAIGRQYPEDKRIKQGIENLLANPDLTPAYKVALERALLTVDPEAGVRQLSKHLAPPAQNLSLEDQRSAIQSILRATDGKPELAAKFAPLINELIAKGPAELLPQLADGLQQQRWPDREAYGLMLKHSRNLESVRLSAISGLGQLAKQGDQAALQALADYYPKAVTVKEQSEIKAHLTGLSQSQGTQAAQAGKLLAALPQPLTAKAPDPKAPAIQADIDTALKDYQRRYKELGQVSPDPFSMSYHYVSKDIPDVTSYFTPANKENLLKHGSAQQKADFIQLLRGHGGDKARGLILDILKSTKTRAELDEIEDRVRGKQEARTDYGFSGKQKADYAHHQDQLRQFDYRLTDTTREVMKMKPAEKGEYLGYAVADYTKGLLSQDEAREALTHIIESIGSKQDYDAVLSAMKTKFPEMSEANLVEILGQGDFDKLRGNVGVAPAKLSYSSEKEFIEIANKFFDGLSQLEGDDYLSTSNLVRSNPKIREQLFFRFFLDPGYYQQASPSERTKLLDNRMKLAKLIASGEVKVGTVPPYFADKYLFGKNQLGVFELSGDFHLKDFVGGSVRDKAKQYVAIEEFSSKIYDVTKTKFSEMQSLLTSQANDPQLDQKLKHKAELLKPYAAAFRPPSVTDPRKPQDKLLAQIRAENQKLNPKLSEADMKLKADVLLAYQRFIQEYGTEGPRAAAILHAQAAKLGETAKNLGITSGDYQQDRLEFRKKAYALYRNDDMDLLKQAYNDALGKMSPDARAVVKNADKLEDEIDTAKDVVVIAGKIVGGMVGLGLLIDITEFGVKLAQHYDKSDMVDKVRRSPEAHARELDAVLTDAVITAGVSVAGAVKDARVDKAATAAAENIQKTTVTHGSDYAQKQAQELLEKRLRDEARDAFIDHAIIDPTKGDVVEQATGHKD